MLESVSSLRSLAQTYRNAGDSKRAITMYEDCLKRTETKLGHDHSDTINTLNSLAFAYLNEGKGKRAVAAYEDCLKRSEAGLGPDHPDTINIFRGLCNSYEQIKDIPQAVKLRGVLLARVRRSQPKDSPELGNEIAVLTMSMLQADMFAEAEPLLHECLTIRQAIDPDAWPTFNTRAMLGAVYLQQKNMPRPSHYSWKALMA